jgi:hypothetical protein
MPKIKKFSGINNVRPAEECRPGDLQVADNVVITDYGSIKRRKGQELMLSSVGDSLIRSLFQDGDNTYAMAGSTHGYTDEDGNWTVTRNYVEGGNTRRMYHMKINDVIYLSNGIESHVIVDDVCYDASVTAPTAITFLPPSGSGNTIPAGRYQFALAAKLKDGSESPAAIVNEVDIAAGQSIGFWIFSTNEEFVDGFSLYISAPDGGAGDTGNSLYKIYDSPSSGATDTITSLDNLDTDDYGQECRTLNMSPMPFGGHMCFYRGRMYMSNAAGTAIVFSEPWMYLLTNLDRNFIAGTDTIRGLLPVENGIWVLTDEKSYFLGGKDPHIEQGFEVKATISGTCLDCGVITDSEKLGVRGLAPGKVALWVTENGIYVGDANGQYRNLTDGVWEPPSTSIASTGGVIHEADNEDTYYFACNYDLYAMNLSNKAVTRALDLVGSNKSGPTELGDYVGGLSFRKSDGALLVARANTGVVTMTHADSDNQTHVAADIDATITKGGIDFDDNMVKKFTDFYLHMKSDGNLSITITSESGSGTVTLTDGIDTMHGSKADLPRGVRGRNLQFSIANVDGADFEIAEIDMVVDASRSRRGRQTGG